MGGGGVVFKARYFGEALGEEWGGGGEEGVEVFFFFSFLIINLYVY